MEQAKAVVKSARIAPRKVRLVVDLIRGKDVGEAISILRHTQRGASPVVEKVLNSAIANAEHNYELDPENLIVSGVYVGEGATLKRFRPRAQGRASRISNITSQVPVLMNETKKAYAVGTRINTIGLRVGISNARKSNGKADTYYAV